ncbi:winged helix-turn-helix domain-containing protein [Raoultella ornithinolytica]|uniref:winged helix-turn-helix domain-containing protein n=1 Tax=Raoultella ornithinolytica TaxID=54291 RepID=UPI0013EFB351|nr:winged helix-turn-helix domain-containing protein [Raoultella ornithinolytica]
MNKIFDIDGRVAFHSGRNELVSQTRHEIKETLNVPCARCLEMLLNAPGQIISQAELYKAGWGDGWKEVSPNTLYQNILLARKALRAVSESDDEFIITVPRKGFRFNEGIPVTDCEPGPITESRQTTGMAKDDSVSDGRPVGHLLLRFLTIAACTFFILSAAILALGFHKFGNTFNDDFSDNYIYFQTRSECDIYLNKRKVLTSAETEHILNTWPMLTSDCKLFPLRYLTESNYKYGIFFLSCNTQDKAHRICRSGYLRIL